MKGGPKVPLKPKSDMNKHSVPAISTEKPSFKSGGALPSVTDLGGNKENKSKVSFAEPDLGFSMARKHDPVMLDDSAEEEEDYGEGNSDFDANELLDLNSYKNKRQ